MRRILFAAVVGCMALVTTAYAQPGGGTNNQPDMTASSPPPMPPAGGMTPSAKPIHRHGRHLRHLRRHRAHHAMMRGGAPMAPATAGAMGAAPPT